MKKIAVRVAAARWRNRCGSARRRRLDQRLTTCPPAALPPLPKAPVQPGRAEELIDCDPVPAAACSICGVLACRRRRHCRIARRAVLGAGPRRARSCSRCSLLFSVQPGRAPAERCPRLRDARWWRWRPSSCSSARRPARSPRRRCARRRQLPDAAGRRRGAGSPSTPARSASRVAGRRARRTRRCLDASRRRCRARSASSCRWPLVVRRRRLVDAVALVRDRAAGAFRDEVLARPVADRRRRRCRSCCSAISSAGCT